MHDWHRRTWDEFMCSQCGTTVNRWDVTTGDPEDPCEAVTPPEQNENPLGKEPHGSQER